MSARPLAIVLGASAAIGRNICEMLLENGNQVVGTYRSEFAELDSLASRPGMTLVQADLTVPQDVQNLAVLISTIQQPWQLLFSSVGSSEPIGRFFELDFENWQHSIDINFMSQLRTLHAIYPYRDKSRVVDIGLLAGGGTNNPFRCYSAYCVAKIGLIKMCELLDDETDDINIFILGPGFVRTKTHYETLLAGSRAEGNLRRVREFMESGNQGTSFEDIYACLNWSREIGRDAVGGRNISVVHDPWGDDSLASELVKDRDMFKLRRARNDFNIVANKRED